MKRVLVVDDHEENLYLLQVLLQSQGYTVELARNGAEALENARLQPPDLIVSDILMPVMDGFTLCRAWKADERLRSVPFIFYTATYTDPRDEQLALDLGADAFITKPAEPDAFMAAVLDVLSQSEGSRLGSSNAPVGDEGDTLRQYSEALVRRLEHKMLELERVNQELEHEIAERRQVEESLRRQLAVDELVKDLLSQTVGASAAELDALLETALARIARFMGVDSAIIFSVSDDLKTWGAAHEWVAPNSPSAVETLRKVHLGTLPWVEGELLAGRSVRLRSLDDLPSQAVDLRALLQRRNRVSGLMVPLRGRGSLVRGCLTLFTVQTELPWEVADVRQGEQLAETIAGILGRKHMEESLRASDERLRQAQKMEAIGQLAGGIAHDFNNLLTAILGFSDLILVNDHREPPSPEVEAVLEIRKAAQRAAELTGQILAFSRRQALRPEVVSLNDVIGDVRPLLERALGEDVDVRFELDPGLGRCEVDPHQLVSVLMNLCVNARDAMPRGGRLGVETANVSLDEDDCAQHDDCRPGDYILLSVSDTGMGMDKETQSHIFEPFFTTKDPGHGTGLGLSTVHGIVSQSGGHIFLCSEPGRGSTFKVYLPRSEKAAHSRVAAPPVERRRPGGETLLVVEDEEVLRALIKRALGAEGYKVLLAAHGEEALAMVAREEHIDLLLTDLALPGEIQGDAVVQRALELWPDLPVLCVSGYSRNMALPVGGADRVVNYLEKPFTIAGLSTKVREVLDAG